MLLTISTTHRPATDLGYLLHKNPGALQTFSLAYGPAHVFYPEASEDRCTAALLVDVDPVGLVRGRRGEAGEFPRISTPFSELAATAEWPVLRGRLKWGRAL